MEAASGSLVKSFALAKCVGELRAFIFQLVPAIRPLVGTHLGFRTDKPYSDDVVADCLTEAVIHDVRWVGNEMNIIAGRMYRTKEHYTRKVGELPGLTDLDPVPSIPRLTSDGAGAIVHYKATWKLNGVPQTIDRDFAIRVNNGMGADAITGKATRKMLAAIHARVTGSAQSMVDIETDIGDIAAVAESQGTPKALAEGSLDLRKSSKPEANGTNGHHETPRQVETQGAELPAERQPGQEPPEEDKQATNLDEAMFERDDLTQRLEACAQHFGIKAVVMVERVYLKAKLPRERMKTPPKDLTSDELRAVVKAAEEEAGLQK